jgi:sugar (pentulose or hexulose) kinase
VSALGGYACAKKAVGEFGTLEEAVEPLAGMLQTVQPDPVAHMEYQDYYERWTRLQDDLGRMPL